MSSALLDAGYFLRGAAIGLAIAAPVGPIGLLCIQRTLTQGRVVGLATGLGAATADGIYGLVAALGLSVLADALVAHSGWLQLAGAAFLLVLGVRTFVASPADTAPPLTTRGLLEAYATTVLLTLANPLTILAFIAIFAGSGLADPEVTVAESLALVGGVFGGSALWWFALSGGVALLRHRLDVPTVRWINRAAGLLILGFALVLLARRG